MRAVVQRVKNAAVDVGGERISEIGMGYLVLLGVGEQDTELECEKLVQKLVSLRIFSDENDKINLSLKDIGGELLVVSQFTLYADCRKGNRPSFTTAKPPAEAERLYDLFCEICKKEIPSVKKGIFGADMKVSLLNDGPFTVVLECVDGKII
ncbi:MAG: D-aminoacyl-tRNA deacylase [Oscillospiraceae bacterium]